MKWVAISDGSTVLLVQEDQKWYLRTEDEEEWQEVRQQDTEMYQRAGYTIFSVRLLMGEMLHSSPIPVTAEPSPSHSAREICERSIIPTTQKN